MAYVTTYEVSTPEEIDIMIDFCTRDLERINEAKVDCEKIQAEIKALEEKSKQVVQPSTTSLDLQDESNDALEIQDPWETYPKESAEIKALKAKMNKVESSMPHCPLSGMARCFDKVEVCVFLFLYFLTSLADNTMN